MDGEADRMMLNPRIGQRVRVHYRKSWATFMPWHGRTGIVRIACRKGRPRNHGVEIDGQMIVIPCGNLVKGEEGDHQWLAGS